MYDGEWYDGKQEGEGTYVWTWGDSFTGQYRGGKMNGRGTHTYADGGRFVGMMEQDVRKGYGEFHYFWGDQYKGYYEDDLKQNGMWYFNNGECKACRWVFDGETPPAPIMLQYARVLRRWPAVKHFKCVRGCHAVPPPP